jgi:hypothetical protein
MAALNGNVLFSPIAELIALEGLNKSFINREERQVSLSPPPSGLRAPSRTSRLKNPNLYS